MLFNVENSRDRYTIIIILAGNLTGLDQQKLKTISELPNTQKKERRL